VVRKSFRFAIGLPRRRYARQTEDTILAGERFAEGHGQFNAQTIHVQIECAEARSTLSTQVRSEHEYEICSHAWLCSSARSAISQQRRTYHA
jgi:hypothetical protein